MKLQKACLRRKTKKWWSYSWETHSKQASSVVSVLSSNVPKKFWENTQSMTRTFSYATLPKALWPIESGRVFSISHHWTRMTMLRTNDCLANHLKTSHRRASKRRRILIRATNRKTASQERSLVKHRWKWSNKWLMWASWSLKARCMAISTLLVSGEKSPLIVSIVPQKIELGILTTICREV